MTKQETVLLKGIAILFMLYLHLFNQMQNVELCTNFILLGGVPLSHILTRGANPVAIYVILSGYGLYKSYRGKGRIGMLRIPKLYIHYWITLLLFVSLGSFLRPDTYPGGFWTVFQNITAWKTSYNLEIWFLFPYIILILCAPWIFSLFCRLPVALTLCSAILWGGVYGILYLFGRSYLFAYQAAYMPLLVLSLLFPFLLGAIMARYRMFERCRDFFSSYQPLLLLLMVLLVGLRLSTDFDFLLHMAFVPLFLMFFIALRRPGWVDSLLLQLGMRSTSMWFVHSYFCYYLFHDFIYGFKYPLLIFVVLVTICYFVSVFIDRIYDIAVKFTLQPIRKYDFFS